MPLHSAETGSSGLGMMKPIPWQAVVKEVTFVPLRKRIIWQPKKIRAALGRHRRLCKSSLRQAAFQLGIDSSDLLESLPVPQCKTKPSDRVSLFLTHA